MDEYFKFKFWKEIISIGLVALLIVSLALTTLFYGDMGSTRRRTSRITSRGRNS